MSGYKSQTRMDRRQKPRAFGWAAALCLALLVLFALVQVAHVHAVDSDADHCPICIVMHSAAPVAAATVAILLVRLNAPAPPLLEARAVIRYWHPTLFTRPPPSGC